MMKDKVNRRRDTPLIVKCKECGKPAIEIPCNWYQMNWYYAPVEIRPKLRELFPGINHEQFISLKYRLCKECYNKKHKKHRILKSE